MFRAALIVAAFLGATAAAAQPIVDNPTLPIRFARGAHRQTVPNAVTPGRRDVYSLRARAGQTMTVSLDALHDDAVFVINGTTAEFRDIGGGGDAIVLVPLTGSVNAGVRSWSGRLPATGPYAILVTATGEAPSTYRLTVDIR